MTPKNNTTCPQTIDQAHDYIHRQLLHEILEQNRFMYSFKNMIVLVFSSDDLTQIQSDHCFLLVWWK